MKILNNNKDVTLMIWECNPKLRNKNNKVCFVTDANTEIKVGDVISCNPLRTEVNNKSFYEIISVEERRKSSLTVKDYLTVRTKWSTGITETQTI